VTPDDVAESGNISYEAETTQDEEEGKEKDETPEERSETPDPSSRGKVTKFKVIYIYVYMLLNLACCAQAFRLTG